MTTNANVQSLVGMRTAAVVPLASSHGPLVATASLRTTQCATADSAARLPMKLTFREAFGVLGAPLLIILTVSVVWTSWLIALAVVPNLTANYLMNTDEYDAGDFWLLNEPKLWITVLSIAGLVAVVLGYVYVMLKMVLWRSTTSSSKSSSQDMRMSRSLSSRLEVWSKSFVRWVSTPLGSYATRVHTSWKELTGFRGTNRKFWNLCLKCIDLVLQSVTLAKLLDTGSPPTLVYCYAALVATNAASCVVMIWLGHRSSAFAEVLVDSIFDLVVAVVFPIVVLAYCYTNFDFDHTDMRLALAVFPTGSFEHQARLMADPSEISLFRTSFDSLRILTPVDLGLRLGINLSFCYRLKRVVDVQLDRVQRAAQQHRSQPIVAITHRSVPLLVALPFALFSCAVVAIAHGSMAASSAACATYPQCVVYAHRLRTGELCPCITLIDVDKMPATYDEWMHSTDATDVVKQLAKSGDLQALQMINRRLPELPIELQRCTNMEHISLIYTETQVIPSWASALTKLQYLHIEGKAGFTNLVSVPDDLFAGMNSLTSLHLGMHPTLTHLPSFHGPTRLNTLALAYLFSLTDMPSFAPLTHLKRLTLVYLPALPSLSDLAPLQALKTFALFRPNQMCCNGFLGVCDLHHPHCTADVDKWIPPVECLAQGDSRRATPATLQVFEHYAPSVCQLTSANYTESLTAATIGMCDRTPFKRCELPTLLANGTEIVETGICVNARMQALACSLDPFKIQMRQLQIYHSVAPACDPVVEQWLGCKA